ncbi:hypothetical protein [Devosia sp. MC521]|uniref:hypothetical protein n=1 Tax=Devosia sp. MC521 TaxID=2759954 RepID=UPI0015FE4048|nr:hypothetical protein [Devosia sp. MC521]MBJ6986058.1 hypothetical protein [Devosia sp. MC521]QMW61428.1 hypothetical protein H4N61_10580 [Devosia sp. MC521]
MKTNLLAGLRSASTGRQREAADVHPVARAASRRPIIQIDHEVPLTAAELAAPKSEPMDFRDQHPFFNSFALQLYDRGWMPIPQTRLGGRRMPSKVDGATLQWGKYIEARASRDTVAYWARDPAARHCNIAVVLGKPSRNTFGIDIDILNARMAMAVQLLAVEHLGETMVRFGRQPKAMMLYRVEDAADLPAYGKFVIAGDDGQPNGELVEILGNGRMVTMIGVHYETGNLFQHDGGLPQMHAIEERITLVTAAQIRSFLNAVAELLPLHVPPRAQYEEVDLSMVDSDGIRVPQVKAWGGNEWQESDGLVIDGREAFMYKTAREFARNNPAAPLTVLVPMVVDAFLKRQHPLRAWSVGKAQELAHEKVRSALHAVETGRLSPARRRRKSLDAAPKVDVADVTMPIERRVPEIRTEGPPLSFLPMRRRSHIAVSFSKADPVLSAQRAIQADRGLVGKDAAEGNVAGIDAFIRDVIARQNRVHVLSGATGIGKSSMTIKRLAEMMGEIFSNIVQHDDEEGAAEGMGPLVMLVPTYNNVEDLRSKAKMLHLDRDASDADLIAAAAALGIVAEGDLKDHLEQLKRFAVGSGLEFMVYKGKVAAGCLRAEEMRLLQKANVPTSAMCRTKARLKDAFGKPTGEPVEQLCQFYHQCPAIRQKSEIQGKHLIFMVRNFLTLKLPEELQNPPGVIMDERMFDLLIHEASMPLSTLDTARRDPVLGKKEWGLGLRPADLLQDREEAVGHAKPVLRQRGDLARHFADLVVDRGGKKVLGIYLVKSARRVCGSGMTSQADLSPDITAEEVRALCAAPKGTRIGEEYRFWSILEEQVQTLLDRRLDSTVVVAPDHRIRVLGELTSTAEDGTTTDLDPELQMAWRTDPNWKHVPTLLLDASTDEVITSLAMGGRDVVVHRTTVNLNQHVVLSVDRRLSNKSLFPGKDAPIERKIEAAMLLHELRTSISMFAGTHAHGRVLIGTTMRLRRAILKDWARPANVDFLHYGATAGLDFARQHVAAMFISRMELPVRTIDGLVAALGFGQMEPEAPIDPLGTGMDADGEDIEHNTVRLSHPLRDGGSATWDRDQHRGDLARRIQRQYREMEQMQFIGRLRSVYRETAGMVLGISSTPPEDLVADEIVGLKDLTQGGVLWDAVRIASGIVNAAVLAKFAPHLGEVEQFERMIQDEFLSNPLIVGHYHQVTAALDDGTEQLLYIPGHQQGWRHRLGAQLRSIGWVGRLIKPVECAAQTIAAEEAPQDEILEVLEKMDAYGGESGKLRSLVELLMSRGEWRPTESWTDPFGRNAGAPVKAPGTYRAGVGGMASKALPLGVWLAMDAIADPWVRDGAFTEAEAREMDLDMQKVKIRKAA